MALTLEEHDTRAALLDRRYDIRTNMYVDWRNETERFLDADTLEPVTREVFTRRLADHLDGLDPELGAKYRRWHVVGDEQ